MTRTPAESAALLRRGALALFLLSLALAPIVAGTFDIYAQSTITCVLLLAGALHLGARRLSRGTVRTATPVDLPVLLLIATTLLSLVFSVDKHASVIELVRLLSCVVAFYLAAAAAGEQGSRGEGERGSAESTTKNAECRVQTAKREVQSAKRQAHGTRRAAAALPCPPAPPLPRSPAPFTALWAALIAGAAWAGLAAVREYVHWARE